MNRPHILQTGPIPGMEAVSARCDVHRLWEAPDAERLLAEVGDRIRGVAAGPRVPVNATLMRRLPALEIVASFGVGYDHVDAAWAGEHGIVVTHTPDVLTEEVADLAVGLLLATVRRLPQADRYLREGRWLERPFPLTASLRGRTIGILGLGRIGRAIARRLEAFDLPIAYQGRRAQPDVSYTYYDDLAEMARAVDVLVAVAPGGRETEGLIGAAVLEALGPQGILINVGRGSVVDEPALIGALQRGVILAAGLDVFADEPRVPAELLALENAVLLPHVGSGSVRTRQAMGQLVADNLLAWFEERRALTPVPETPLDGTPQRPRGP